MELSLPDTSYRVFEHACPSLSEARHRLTDSRCWLAPKCTWPGPTIECVASSGCLRTPTSRVIAIVGIMDARCREAIWAENYRSGCPLSQHSLGGRLHHQHEQPMSN